MSEDQLPKDIRIVRRLRRYFEENSLPDDKRFSHDAVARYLADNIDDYEKCLDVELNRFQKCFDKLNNLLP